MRPKEQLNGLMKTLMSTKPHFIRCIIPNEEKAPGKILPHNLVHPVFHKQLDSTGTLV